MTHNPILDWLSALRRTRTDLSHSARSVALAILSHCNADTGMTRPISYAEVQEEAGCSRGTLVTALRQLEDAGLLRRFGSYRQLNAYILTVSPHQITSTPGPDFDPSTALLPDLAACTGPIPDPDPVQNPDHKESLSSSSSLSLVEEAGVLGLDNRVPLPRDWSPNPQHLTVARARGLDLDAVVAEFITAFSGKTRTREKWDTAFGWWLKPAGGWDNRQVSAATPAPSSPKSPSVVMPKLKRELDRDERVAIAVQALTDRGLVGESVRARVEQLVDVGTQTYRIAGIVVDELGSDATELTTRSNSVAQMRPEPASNDIRDTRIWGALRTLTALGIALDDTARARVETLIDSGTPGYQVASVVASERTVPIGA